MKWRGLAVLCFGISGVVGVYSISRLAYLDGLRREYTTLGAILREQDPRQAAQYCSGVFDGAGGHGYLTVDQGCARSSQECFDLASRVQSDEGPFQYGAALAAVLLPVGFSLFHRATE